MTEGSGLVQPDPVLVGFSFFPLWFLDTILWFLFPSFGPVHCVSSHCVVWFSIGIWFGLEHQTSIQNVFSTNTLFGQNKGNWEGMVGMGGK